MNDQEIQPQTPEGKHIEFISRVIDLMSLPQDILEKLRALISELFSHKLMDVAMYGSILDLWQEAIEERYSKNVPTTISILRELMLAIIHEKFVDFEDPNPMTDEHDEFYLGHMEEAFNLIAYAFPNYLDDDSEYQTFQRWVNLHNEIETTLIRHVDYNEKYEKDNDIDLDGSHIDPEDE